MRRVARVMAPAIVALVCSAHVGTLDTFFSGNAGPYRVQVTVRPPGVVPGQAQILVRVADADVRRVAVSAAPWRLGSRGAPPPDEARPVPGEPRLFAAELWLMARGSYSVMVRVDGARGVATALVPVASLATRQLGMTRGLGTALGAFGLVLVGGLLSIVGAGAREASLAPGDRVGGGQRRRARLATAAAALLVGVLLTGGWRWWRGVDADYARGLASPRALSATIDAAGGVRTLRVAAADTGRGWRDQTPIVPDHGKMVHLFLIGTSASPAIAHLHPARVGVAAFEGVVGALPEGRYRVFADVVHESGLAETLVGAVDVPRAPGAERVGDPDDAVFDAGTPGDASPTRALAGGGSITWLAPPTASTRVRDDWPLRFAVRDAQGRPAVLEPYLGMPGHAVVARDDGAVFMHLHAMGSVSPTAQAVLAAVERGDTVHTTDARGVGRPRPVLAPGDTAAMPAAHHASDDGTLSFPFAFPAAGRYWIWVQVRVGGAIATARFSATIAG